MFQSTAVSSKEELENILSLQKDNLSGNLSYEGIQIEGFITLVHNMEILEQLHSLAPVL